MQLGALLLETNSPRQIHAQLAFRSLDFNRARGNLNLHSRGHGNRFSSNARHSSMALLPGFYQTSQRTSPPTRALRAARPVITPLGVVMMLMPIPPTTGRISEAPLYRRLPGFEMRFKSVITLRRSGVYFRKRRSVFRILFSSTSLYVEMYPSSFRIRATSAFSFDVGMSTRAWRALAALRIRVSKSEIGSVCIVVFRRLYQLAFTTPGISPRSAWPRKQMRHI